MYRGGEKVLLARVAGMSVRTCLRVLFGGSCYPIVRACVRACVCAYVRECESV